MEVISEEAMSRSPSSRAGSAAAPPLQAEGIRCREQSEHAHVGKALQLVGDLNPDQLEIIKELGRGASSYVQLVRDKQTSAWL